MPHALVLFAALAASGPTMAQMMPPAESPPLSEILAIVEGAHPVQAFTDVEWDSDGYWDVDYVDLDGRSSEIRIDPLTGGEWSEANR